MSCGQCRSPLNAGAKFCGNCGSQVVSAPPAYTAQPPQYSYPAQPIPQPGQPYSALGQGYVVVPGQVVPPPGQVYAPVTPQILISATKFNRGRAFTADNGYGDVIQTSGMGHCTTEYDVKLPAPGQYHLKIRFAALERRPINVYIGGALIAQNALAMTTGGWQQANQIWVDVASFVAQQAFVTIKLDQIGPCLPHISQLMVEKVNVVVPVVVQPQMPVFSQPVVMNPRDARRLERRMRKAAKHAKVPCPLCYGKGGIGAFGPCFPADVHYRMKCPCCKGKCKTKRSTLCTRCNGKGGFGAFGPCNPWDVHFRSKCDTCKGTGFRKSRHGSSSSSSDSD